MSIYCYQFYLSRPVIPDSEVYTDTAIILDCLDLLILTVKFLQIWREIWRVFTPILLHRPTQLRAKEREISRLEINKAARLVIVGFYKGMAFSILYWSNYTAGTSKLMRKSEVAVQSEHVLKFVFDKEAQFIRGIVQASMRDRSYQVTVSSFNVNIIHGAFLKTLLT